METEVDIPKTAVINLRSGSIFVRFENYIPAGMAKRKE